MILENEFFKFVMKMRGRKSIHYFSVEKYPGHYPLATKGPKLNEYPLPK